MPEPFCGEKSTYGTSVSLLLEKILYFDHQSIYFRKKVHTWIEWSIYSGRSLYVAPAPCCCGGVAGGAAGIGPAMSGAAALVGSFGMMAAGHVVGRRLGAIQRLVDPRVGAAAAFAALSIAQCVECVRTWW